MLLFVTMMIVMVFCAVLLLVLGMGCYLVIAIFGHFGTIQLYLTHIKTLSLLFHSDCRIRYFKRHPFVQLCRWILKREEHFKAVLLIKKTPISSYLTN